MNAAFFDQLPRQQQTLLRLLLTKDEEADTRLVTLAQELNYADQSGVRYHVNALEAAGLIRWPQIGKNNPKLLRLTNKGRELLEANPPTLTIYEGGAHAGACGVQYEAEAIEVENLAQLLALYGAHYALKVKGSCMDGGPKPIRAGDRVFVRLASPHEGQIVHVELPLGDGDNEVLLREYSCDEETSCVTLKCYNPAPDEAAEMSFDVSEVDVRGVVVTVLHDL